MKDAEELCEFAEKLVKEIDATEFGKRIPSLQPLGEEACMNYRAGDFWTYGTHIFGTKDMRCRAVEDSRTAVSLVVNTPRLQTSYGDEYIGPVLVFSLMMVRVIFAKMRENLKRYYETLE